MRGTYFFALAVMLICCCAPGAAQPAGYPAPAPTPNRLFYLQRTHNSNTIVYDLKLENGKPDPDDPVHAYWIRYQEKGQKEELSFIQRKFAYGMRSRKISDKEYELYIVSFKQQKLYLRQGADGRFHVYARVNNRQLMLTKIYLEMKKGGSAWSPKIEYAELTGIDQATKEEVQERIKL